MGRDYYLNYKLFGNCEERQYSSGTRCFWTIALIVSSLRTSLFWYWMVSVVIHVGGLTRWRPHRRWSLLVTWEKGVGEGLGSLLLTIMYANSWLWVPQVQYIYMYRLHLLDHIQWRQNYLADAPVPCCTVICCCTWSESYCLILGPTEQWQASSLSWLTPFYSW